MDLFIYKIRYGEPYPGTLDIKEALDKGLAQHPEHPGLRHFNIHLYELSLMIENADEKNF